VTGRPTLGCDADGLEAALRFDRLGGYDGADTWSVIMTDVRSDDEQDMVELHEYLHHELQLATGWGVLSGMAALLARRGVRPYALDELFRTMVAAARETHEAFATTLSVLDRGDSGRRRELLAGNSEYLAHLDRGLSVVEGHPVPGSLRFAATSATLEVCMRPAAVLDLLDRGFAGLGAADLDLRRDGPDRRLAAFVRLGGPTSWRPVFDDLLARWPGGAPGAERLPEDAEELERQRRFHEEELLPACHAHAAAVLDAAGLPSIGTTRQSVLAEALREAVDAVDPGLAGQLLLVRRRRPLYEEMAQLERQRVVLGPPLPATVVPARRLTDEVADFRGIDDHGRPYVGAVWADRAVLARQFALPDLDGLPGLTAALVNGTRAVGSVRLGLLPPGTGPIEAQRLVGAVPLVLLTTHATLAAHGSALAALQTVTPVFVLLDLPAGRHVTSWLNQGVDLRIRVAARSHAGRRLVIAAFDILPVHPLVFLRIGSERGTYPVLDMLRRRHPDRVEIVADEPGQDRERAADQERAVDLVLHSWHQLDQRGTG
jgi:hypothetical protein